MYVNISNVVTWIFVNLIQQKIFVQKWKLQTNKIDLLWYEEKMFWPP